MKFWSMVILAFTANFACADTTVYETKDKQGVPSFTNIPQPEDENAKKIVIPDVAVPDNQQQKSAPVNNAQQQAINQELRQVDSTEQKLKAQLEQAQANVQQAQQDLEQARKAMADGTYRVAGDQFVDTDYIHHLEESVDNAKQQLATAENAYNNYRNANK